MNKLSQRDASIMPAHVTRAATVSGGLHIFEKIYPANLRMGRHAHAEWRYCLAVRGSYTDSWRRGYRTRTVRQLSLHPAEEMHTSAFHAATTCFHIEFRGDWRERLLGDAGIAPEPHEFSEGPVPLLAARIYDEFDRRDTCSALVIEGLAYELIGWSGRSLSMERAGASWVYRARDLLLDRFAESLPLAEVAREVGVHPVHLARQFRKTFGCAVGEFVRRRRVEFVCRELQSDAALSDIALRAGFADQSHLGRVFKRFTGMTPRQFRLRC